ncbi:hypothetical protein P378_05305 [Desulforamulus profundi]|uniref:histidine kinase n=1 Tax=Desulforamulus profundi TaxID=1383067 RepID=A0A2C6MH98_9FIRM|nr:ATP-binding protein [Desulforamulus profundi]PHJ39125.1 hypothetical protein P378_05305 [Desulforamulus profundi]
MLPTFSVNDLQSFPLTMIIENIVDPSSPDSIKQISRNILQSIPQPFLVTDLKGSVILTNNALSKLVYLPTEEINENTICFEQLNLTEISLNKILDFGIPIMDYRDNLIVNKHKRVPIKVNIYPIFGNNKIRLGSVYIVEDITNNIKYNDLLHKSELILNKINTGVICLDKNLKITMFSKCAEKFFNICQREIIGKLFIPFIEKFVVEGANFFKALIEYSELKDYEQVFIINSKTNYFICDTHLFRNDLNESIETILFFKDITRFKEIELQLAKSEKLSVIGELAAGTAHEIRNPLTTVRGFVQIIHKKMKELNIEDFDTFIQLILGEIDRVDGIISNFLNLAKPKKINKEILTVNEIIREVMFLVENEALRKEITPDIVLEDNLPFIEGDKHQLIQVFLNIINNAFQATPVGRKFAIKSKVSSDGTKLIVDFIDSGEGISPENLSKIFDPFFSTKDDGTGLGLAISNRIINDHEGEIKVFSKPGEGSIFSVILPVKR